MGLRHLLTKTMASCRMTVQEQHEMDQLLESRASTTADVHMPEQDLINLVKARMILKGVMPNLSKEQSADGKARRLLQQSGVNLVNTTDKGSCSYVIPKGYPDCFEE